MNKAANQVTMIGKIGSLKVLDFIIIKSYFQLIIIYYQAKFAQDDKLPYVFS